MRAIIFLSSDDLIEQLMELHKDVDDSSIEDLGPQTSQDDDNYKRVYAESMEEIRRYHKDYPYIKKTKRYSCWIV